MQILLIEDDPNISARLKDILKKEYSLQTVKTSDEAIEKLKDSSFDLILLDFDLKKEDGLQVFHKINPIRPEVNVVMLSFSNSIPLAVAATKAGVADFIRKPFNVEQVLESAKNNLVKEEYKLSVPPDAVWLHGQSSSLKKFLQNVEYLLLKNKDIILFGEKGINKADVAGLLHDNSVNKKRKLNIIDLADFQLESLEAHFWTIIQKLMRLPDAAALTEEKETCGTIYVENVERGSEDFIATFFNFLENRSANVDKKTRVIVDIRNKKILSKLKIDQYELIQIPSLRERKADIPRLIDAYLKHYAAKYNKEIKFISTEALNVLNIHDYPGNYLELAKIIQAAVLGAKGENLCLADFALNIDELSATALKLAREQGLAMAEAKDGFEKRLYAVLMAKFADDISAAAQFLDMPKTMLEKRCQELNSNFVN